MADECRRASSSIELEEQLKHVNEKLVTSGGEEMPLLLKQKELLLKEKELALRERELAVVNAEAHHSYDDAVFRILLVRHGESMGNVDPLAYNQYADHDLPLTDRGVEMGRQAGVEIDKYMSDVFSNPGEHGRCKLWVSPFRRSRQTAKSILEIAGKWVDEVQESPFLVEQDWGLFEGPGIEVAKTKYPEEFARNQSIRQHQGKFWARYPMGESCFDVCQRVSLLFGTIYRDRHSIGHKRQGVKGTNTIIVVSHGVTIRAFVASYCGKSPEWFQQSSNPPNCSIRLIESCHAGWDKGYIYGGFGTNGAPLPLDSVILQDMLDPFAPKKYYFQNKPDLLRKASCIDCEAHASKADGTSDEHDGGCSQHSRPPCS